MEGNIAGELKFSALLGMLKESLVQIPEHRRGQNGTARLPMQDWRRFRCSSCSRHPFWSTNRTWNAGAIRTMPGVCLGWSRYPAMGRFATRRMARCTSQSRICIVPTAGLLRGHPAHRGPPQCPCTSSTTSLYGLSPTSPPCPVGIFRIAGGSYGHLTKQPFSARIRLPQPG